MNQIQLHDEHLARVEKSEVSAKEYHNVNSKVLVIPWNLHNLDKIMELKIWVHRLGDSLYVLCQNNKLEIDVNTLRHVKPNQLIVKGSDWLEVYDEQDFSAEYVLVKA